MEKESEASSELFSKPMLDAHRGRWIGVIRVSLPLPYWLSTLSVSIFIGSVCLFLSIVRFQPHLTVAGQITSSRNVVMVTSPVNAKVLRLYVQTGQFIKVDQPVALLSITRWGGIPINRKQFQNSQYPDNMVVLTTPQSGTVLNSYFGIGEQVTSGNPVAAILPEGAGSFAQFPLKAAEVAVLRQGLRILVGCNSVGNEPLIDGLGLIDSISTTHTSVPNIDSKNDLKLDQTSYTMMVSLDQKTSNCVRGGIMIPYLRVTLLAEIPLQKTTILSWLLSTISKGEGE